MWYNVVINCTKGMERMKNKKIIAAIIAVVAVIFSVCMLVFAYPHNEMPDNYTEAKDGVVYIVSEHETYIGTGSGFAIGENGKPVQYIVTNYHVVFDTDTGEKADSVTVCFSAAANRYMVAQIYRYSAAKDIAVLRLPEPTNEVKPLKLRKYAENDLSETFYALGYPARATVLTDYERFDKTEIVTTSGMISRQTMISERDVYMIDMEMTSGNSGGPLVNSKGEVVGINTFSVIDTSGDESNYAVCIDELTRLIDGNEMPYTLSTDINGVGIAIIAVTAVVDVAAVAGILVILLLNNSQKVNKAEKPVAKDNKSKNVTVEEISKTVAVDGISKTVAVSDGMAILSCIAGELEGKDFVVKNKVIMGRDHNKCKIVFPLDAEGVSGIHCQVYFEQGKVKLMDLGSTYGTYVGNGLKIDAETAVELKDGDVFSLGSEKNKFSVSIK